MQFSESFKVGITGLLSNKTRAGLTMLGIVFGVAAVIAMVSIGAGAREETLRQIELLGTNNIIVNKKAPSGRGGEEGAKSFSPGLSIKDANSIRAINPYVESITPVRLIDQQIQYQSDMIDYTIVGTLPNYPATYNSEVTEGTFFNQYHIRNYSNVCVIGSGVKQRFFKYEDAVNKKIKIGELWFQIIGVLSPKNVTSSGSNNFGIRDFNEDIYIPLATMTYKMEKLEEEQSRSRRNRDDEAVKVVDKNSVDQLTVKIKDSDRLPEAAELISRILERKHYGVDDYEVILPEQLLAQKQKTQMIFNVVMGAIAGISLLVGGIGIMNIMLANILERTREIGVRRAVGATRYDILTQFMFEAVTISVIGGLLGILLGFILTRLISSYAGWTTVISPVAIVFAFIVSVATGVIFGIYPAKKAADKNPIESLRYE